MALSTVVRPVAMATRQVKKATKKAAPAKSAGAADRTLWLPVTTPPPYLDGSLPGDAGFDPLGLGKPVEFVQLELDQLDQNAPKNVAGRAIGKIKPNNAAPEDSIVPYEEVFDILRFRECELIHGRWCMLATLGAFVAELNTGVNWVDAGKVELEQAQYLGLELPFDITTLTIIEVLVMGYIEFARNSESDREARCYPGGPFDPLGLATDQPEERVFRLRTQEIKHGRLAMVAFFGYAVQAGKTGTGSVIDNLTANFN
mmetsp:Transcript_2123/g.7376  ORF Transcript_2123/g.7376 Transcript_2123/m.7376 type:complete len:258 (+) Transcript_2123:92-865(+)|eukprot:CAMPEP_0183788876 /NCGR_PEP_ID=MMETSP0803_2-20130417/5_1 /TAXON_ID=195967 /ORGANISM="Crustomastix stigmata, Strain CCMP3273" /LENGTH=257 /DNA_ID=CAMNT_0026033025 /DNA_START=40 /DNA_END=813 /DNA_ORIENTATION=+